MGADPQAQIFVRQGKPLFLLELIKQRPFLHAQPIYRNMVRRELQNRFQVSLPLLKALPRQAEDEVHPHTFKTGASNLIISHNPLLSSMGSTQYLEELVAERLKAQAHAVHSGLPEPSPVHLLSRVCF